MEKENVRLKQFLAELSLDNAILPQEHRDDVKEVLSKKWSARTGVVRLSSKLSNRSTGRCEMGCWQERSPIH